MTNEFDSWDTVPYPGFLPVIRPKGSAQFREVAQLS
jgi:hypothetical protein